MRINPRKWGRDGDKFCPMPLSIESHLDLSTVIEFSKKYLICQKVLELPLVLIFNQVTMATCVNTPQLTFGSHQVQETTICYIFMFSKYLSRFIYLSIHFVIFLFIAYLLLYFSIIIFICKFIVTSSYLLSYIFPFVWNPIPLLNR